MSKPRTPEDALPLAIEDLKKALDALHAARGYVYGPTGIPVGEREARRARWLKDAVCLIDCVACLRHEQLTEEIEAARHDAIAAVIANPPAAFTRHTANDFEGTEK